MLTLPPLALPLLALPLLALPAAIAAGAKSAGSGDTVPGDDSGAINGAGSGSTSGTGGNDAGISSLITADGGTPPVAGGQITAAGGPNIVVNGQPKGVQLTATANGSPVAGTWTTSDPAIGSVGSDGVFHANGFVGGTVDVALVVGMRQIKITLTVDVDITDNPAMLSATDQAALKAGGAADPSFKFLYPFDGTVFPARPPNARLAIWRRQDRGRHAGANRDPRSPMARPSCNACLRP